MRNIKKIIIKLLSLLNFCRVDFFEIILKLSFFMTGRNRSFYNTEHEFRSVLKFINSIDVFIDIGANVGSYSDLLLNYNKKTNMFLIEPNKKNFNFLKIKYKKKNNIKIFNVALGSNTKNKYFYSSKRGSGLDSFYNRKFQIDHRIKSKDGFQLIKFKKSYLAKSGLFKDLYKSITKNNNKKVIDLVKIDTEGSELDILKGMGQNCIKNIKIIQFEFGSSNIDSKKFFIEFYIFFKKNNFDIYRITPGIPRKINYSYFDEVFSTNNYIAVNKKFN